MKDKIFNIMIHLLVILVVLVLFKYVDSDVLHVAIITASVIINPKENINKLFDKMKGGNYE